MSKESKIEVDKRKSIINDFNRNNEGKYFIHTDKTPSKEEIEQVKKEYEDAAIALRDKKDYLIADEANALRVAQFLKEFIENGFWMKRYYVGVINFSSYIDEFISSYNTETKPLVMEYAPMQFVYLMLDNYAGQGLEAAKKMGEIWDEYVPIYDTFKDHIEWYNNETKRIEELQQRWAMFENGYYLEILPEEGKELSYKQTPDIEIKSENI